MIKQGETLKTWTGERFITNHTIVVECDEQNFHDRAISDQPQDTDLEQSGYEVLRFTSLDIKSGSLASANEVVKSITQFYARSDSEYSAQYPSKYA